MLLRPSADANRERATAAIHRMMPRPIPATPMAYNGLNDLFGVVTLDERSRTSGSAKRRESMLEPIEVVGFLDHMRAPHREQVAAREAGL